MNVIPIQNPSRSVTESLPKNGSSPREDDVQAKLMLGPTTDAVAAELGISANTCRGYTVIGLEERPSLAG